MRLEAADYIDAKDGLLKVARAIARDNIEQREVTELFHKFESHNEKTEREVLLAMSQHITNKLNERM